MFRTRHLFLLLLLAIHVDWLPAQGPNRPLVYVNNVGSYQNMFVLSPAGQVSGARYRLGGQTEPTQYDRLTFVGSVEFRDANDDSLVRGWEYKGTDKTLNTWRIIFSKHPHRARGTYRVYYSLGSDGPLQRWLTEGGTRRGAADFSHEAHAILWANQVDSDRLGLRPFSTSQLDPLAPALAWQSVTPELNRLLRLRYGDFSGMSATLVRLPDSRLRFMLEAANYDCRRDLFQVLGYRDNLQLGFVERHVCQTMTVDRAQLSLARILRGSSIDMQRVADQIAEVIEIETPSLSRLQAMKRVDSSECMVYTRPWVKLSAGLGFCQYWRLNYGFKIVRENGIERYRLSTTLDIGERREHEPETNEYITLRYTSQNPASFAHFSFDLAPDARGRETITRRRTVQAELSGINNGKTPVRMECALSCSNLGELLSHSFEKLKQKFIE